MYLLFNIREMTESNARHLYEKLALKDLVVLAKENGWHSCYAIRKHDKKFNLRKGTASLAKKMIDTTPNDLEIIPIGYNTKLPEKFFERLDVDKINEQVLYAFGKYADFSQIEACMEQSITGGQACMEQSITGGRKRHVNSTLVKKGALKSVRDGIIRFGQYTSAKTYVSEVEREEEKARRLAKDVEFGDCIRLRFKGAAEAYEIVSRRGETGSTAKKSRWNRNEAGKWDQIDEGPRFTKHKHYFFYSTKPGYYKTSVALAMVDQFNVSLITDPNNSMNLSEDAQFLIVDEYGPKRRLHMGDLKCLTAGDARTYSGNRKSYGNSFHPRPDVQLILFSNHHLFACMGSWNATLGRHVVTPETATLLSDRFHIVKLDEGAEGASTEREDREYYTAAPSDMPMTRKRCREFDFDDETTGAPSRKKKFKCLARMEYIADTHELNTFMAYVKENESWIYPLLADFYSPENGEDLFETCVKRHGVDREGPSAYIFKTVILPRLIAAKKGIPYEPPRVPFCSEEDEDATWSEDEEDDTS
jgi:hypothetical protein